MPLHLVHMSGGSEVSLAGWLPEGVTYRADPDLCAPLPSLPKDICLTSLSILIAAAVAAGTAALGGAAWYARRRFSRS